MKGEGQGGENDAVKKMSGAHGYRCQWQLASKHVLGFRLPPLTNARPAHGRVPEPTIGPSLTTIRRRRTLCCPLLQWLVIAHVRCTEGLRGQQASTSPKEIGWFVLLVLETFCGHK